MQGVFITAFTYTPPIILGRQLFPFSSFHGLILEATESPYLIGGKRTYADAIFGVWVCSHFFADGYLGTMNYKAVRAWSKKARKPDLKKAADEFEAYISASLIRPEHWISDKDKSCRAPIWWILATSALTKLCMTEQQAWDCSVTKLFCYAACRNEMEGDNSLVSDEENAIRLKMMMEK